MPLTPTDPTKPQVWVTGQAPNQVLDFYIPQGPKGDPGGFTNNPVLSTTDLDQILTPGTYSVSNAVDVPGSMLRHLPFHEAGSLIVTASQENAGVIIQTYITNTKNMYVRRKFSGAWNSWRAYASTRVDQTAGRVIYTYDEVNAREQLTWGDTGRRNITSSFPNPVSGAVYLSRNGMYVNLIMADYQDGSAAGTLSTAAGVIPVGFRPQNWLYQPAPSARLLVIKSDGGLTMNSHSATVWQGGYTWRTEDAWPTTLPGTAVGSIPNA
jgi:hypothetical protein